jgi:hypothetical protein
MVVSGCINEGGAPSHTTKAAGEGKFIGNVTPKMAAG